MGFLAEEQIENMIRVRAKTKEKLLSDAIKEMIGIIYAKGINNRKITQENVEAEAEDFEDLAISILQKTIDLSKKRRLLDVEIIRLDDTKIMAVFKSQNLDKAELIKKLGLVTYYGFELKNERGIYELKFHYD